MSPLPARLLRVMLRVTAALVLAGVVASCGGGGDVYYDEGYLYLWNRTDETPFPEYVVEFGIAPAGYPVTNNILPGPLPWGAQVYLGAFFRDYYDAVAVLEFGDEVWYYDVFIGNGADVVLEVF